MRVALVLPPSWSTLTAPLGIASVAGAAIQAGHDVRVFDLNARCWNALRGQTEDIWQYSNYLKWERETEFQQSTFSQIAPEFKKQLAEIFAMAPDIVGLSLFSTSIPAARVFLRMLNLIMPECPVVVGGPAVTESALKENLNPRGFGWNYAVIGEGEGTIVDLLHRLEMALPLEGCLGLAVPCEGDKPFRYFGDRPNIDLNELPKPYFGDFDFGQYQEQRLPLMMSRGCVAKCTFCGETRFWKRFRYREAKAILAEFMNHARLYGIRDFAIADSLVNGNFRVLSDLADLIIASGERFTWNGYARVDERMDADLLSRLARSGCTHLSYGVETGSQKILDLMEKRTTVETAKRVIRDTHRSRIAVHLNMIVGFPGETEDDFNATLDFLAEVIDCVSVVNTGETLGIISGTPLATNPHRFGIKTDESGEVFRDRDGNWVSVDGLNTNEVRRLRLMRLRDFLDKFEHVLWFPDGRKKSRLIPNSK